MSVSERNIGRISFALIGSIALITVANSEPMDRRLIGAWHESNSDCAKLFENGAVALSSGDRSISSYRRC